MIWGDTEAPQQHKKCRAPALLGEQKAGWCRDLAGTAARAVTNSIPWSPIPQGSSPKDNQDVIRRFKDFFCSS